MTVERLDHLAALEPERAAQPCKMAVNMRVGQVLYLQPEHGPAIVVEFAAKHGAGGRLIVRAHQSVRITPPEG